MIIGISGKISSGKDTVGKIIQFLVSKKYANEGRYSGFDLEPSDVESLDKFIDVSGYSIKRFAGKVKEICSILTGIPVEDFEKQEVKDRVLGEEWIRYGYADSFYRDMDGNPIMNNKQCTKEEYLEHFKTNWQTAYKHEYTVREILQLVGTNAMRNVIHENIWVNALFSEYKNKWNNLNIARKLNDEVPGNEYPNWIITDVRFPNEADAIKARGGLLIRVNRDWKVQRRKELEATLPDGIYTLGDDIPSEDERKMIINTGKGGKIKYELALEEEMKKQAGEHPSETALDSYNGFDEVIDNNGSIEELIEKVKIILIKYKII